jgi:glycosyltransferase involved in cell wall biosynthesis
MHTIAAETRLATVPPAAFTATLRVLICVDALGLGGKERQAVELIKGLANVPGLDCRVVCFDTDDDFYVQELASRGIQVEFVPRRVRWDPGVALLLHRIVNDYRPDVIHSNGLVSSFYTLPHARTRGVPMINGSIRNAFPRGGLRWSLERWLLKASDYRIANSRAGLLSRGFPENDPRNVVIYNGFDFARVEPSIGDPLAPGSSGVKLVGMVAEFNRFKDYVTFIEAARMVGRRRSDIEFLAIGDGPTLTACQAAAAGLTNLKFLGRRKEVERIVRDFAVGVLCTFVEGLPNSVMEYMALGKPVVATNGGGTGELVVDGETGFLVRQSDPAALAAAIERLVDHPELARRLGTTGRARLVNEFSIDRMLTETVALYSRAARRRA